MFSFTNKKVIGVCSSEVHCSKSMEKSEVIKKNNIFTFRWSENIKFYIFTSENIKYTIYFINIFLYFTTLYIIKIRYRIVNSTLSISYAINSLRER